MTSTPQTADTPPVDAYDAARALSALWRLCESDLASVYTRPQHEKDTSPPKWNVWLEITQRRVELAAWVREWLAAQDGDTSPEGGDAA